MKVTGLENFRDDPKLAAAVERASKLLEAELGRSAERVSVEWGRSRDERGRPLIVLRLSDRTATEETSFTPDELFRESNLEARFIRFWGDFLEKSSHRLLEPILESIREHGGR